MIPRRKIDGVWGDGIWIVNNSDPVSQVMTLIDNKVLSHPNWRTEAHLMNPTSGPGRSRRGQGGDHGLAVQRWQAVHGYRRRHEGYHDGP